MKEGLSLIAAILILSVVDPFTCPDHKGAAPELPTRSLTLPIVVLPIIRTVTNLFPGAPAEASGGIYQYAPMQIIIRVIPSAGTLIMILVVHEWLKREDASIKQGEFYVLISSTLLGMYFMISTGRFLMFLIGLGMMSIPMAALVAFNKCRHHSAEAGVKYILTALFSGILLLSGFSTIYGTLGILYFDDLPEHVTGDMLQAMVSIFFPADMGFRISLAPFHLQTVGVYEGTLTTVIPYLSVISKGLAAFMLMIVPMKALAPTAVQWQEVLFWVTTVSITTVDLFAIRQQNLKRFMVSSIIPQAGHIMPGVIGGSAMGMIVLVYYVSTHLATNLGVFVVILIVEQRSNKVEINDYNGLHQTNLKLAFVMTLALFLLAGIPPFAGFFFEFFISMAVFDSGLHLLIFTAPISTVVSLYYYLLIVKAMHTNPNEEPIPTFRSDGYTKLNFAPCTLDTVALGITSCIYQGIDKFA